MLERQGEGNPSQAEDRLRVQAVAEQVSAIRPTHPERVRFEMLYCTGWLARRTLRGRVITFRK